MDIRNRLRELENRLGKGPEAQFHELVDGTYDRRKSLRENLAAAQAPSGAIPTKPEQGEVDEQGPSPTEQPS